jgi:SpoVK/Ycf46/Vps4 family AAA+-type ATPase
VPTILTGRRTWDPGWSRTIPFIFDVPPPDRAERAAAWRNSVNGDLSHDIDPAAVTGHLRMTPAQIERATVAARWHAIAAGRELTAADLRAGARAQNAAGLERLARRVEPRVNWDDLVLPPETVRVLRSLSSRARHRDLVLEEWGLRGRSGGTGRGIAALFAGPSGTGKTLAAEVIAADVGLELYAIDLATVVDKYVGETEKNLDRIFTEANEVNAVLFFDEADALFGRRSDVRDAHDRYANIEVAFLLQRMESFDGIAILATNLRSNVDDAFTRRLDAIVDFQPPDPDCRRRLWDLCLGRSAPRAADLDLDFCAEAFELAGGNIRSIALAAGYAAAERGDSIAMTDLIAAVEQEYRKLGRLCSEAEFGPWHARLRD